MRILPRSYRPAEFKNVNPFSLQKAHKAVRAGQYLRSLLRRIMPSMQIRVYTRLFLPRHNGCTNARWILSRSYGREEFKYVNPFSVQKSHKAVRDGQYLSHIQLLIVPSMQIGVHSQLILARYNGCTNARCILPRGYGLAEFKYLNPFSVQKSQKAVRAGQYLRPMKLRIVPSMEIGVHSRLILSRYKGCTNARCILPRGNGLAEFKNVNPFSVQKAHKAVRAGQLLRSLLRRIMPSTEIRVYSRLFLSRHNGCTNARWILSRSYGREGFRHLNIFRCKSRTKLYGPANISVPCSSV